MRIAVANLCDRVVGGAETYLATVLPALAARGHRLLLWHETDGDPTRQPLPAERALSVAQLGARRALAELSAWRPEVIFVQQLQSAELEAALLATAPAVLLAHAYGGACVSGTKTHAAPEPARPCGRPFGPACLFHYYPHRCGGLSPLTMWRDWRLQSARRRLLDQFRFVLTASSHMQRTYVQLGLPPERVRRVPLPLPPEFSLPRTQPRLTSQTEPIRASSNGPARLLFAGRMERLKGGHLLLAALPGITAGLGRAVELSFVGDGRERSDCEARAAALTAADARLTVRFLGWQNQAQLAGHYAAADLLVVPSIWPEPFGLVGPEAGRFGLPAAAFAVGGIPDWLTDGVSGHLASADPPTADGIATAVVRCLADPGHHERLRYGARAASARYTVDAHLAELEPLLERASSAR